MRRVTNNDLRAAELDRLEAEGKIERQSGLRIYRYELGATPCVKIWAGKAVKPACHHSFGSVERREQFIAERTANAVAMVAYKVKAKAEAEAKRAELIDAIGVGTLLHYSWGWEQTQCEYFQVVAKRGSTVTIRPIQAKAVDGSDYAHGMACMMQPVRDAFVDDGEPALTKRIGTYGITMPHGTASPCRDDDKHYCSWYA